jgi:hypothetical protein
MPVVDPHAKVPSVEQDNWCQLADVLWANLLRTAMQPKLSPDELAMLVTVAFQAKAFHRLCLCFDAETEAQKELFAKGELS